MNKCDRESSLNQNELMLKAYVYAKRNEPSIVNIIARMIETAYLAGYKEGQESKSSSAEECGP